MPRMTTGQIRNKACLFFLCSGYDKKIVMTQCKLIRSLTAPLESTYPLFCVPRAVSAFCHTRRYLLEYSSLLTYVACNHQ